MKIIFTKHAEYRIKKRNLTKQEVIESINYPNNTFKKHAKYYFNKKLERGIIEICCEKTENNIKVITIYWI